MLRIVNPATEKTIKELEEDSPSSIASKVSKAIEAQAYWATQSIEVRAQAIGRFRDLLVRDSEKLAALLTSEMGKPIKQARNELAGVLGRIDFFLSHFSNLLRTEQVHENERERTVEEISWEPLGVIANISAWNYPYFVGSNVFIPALLTGNAVLYKPSEFSTLTGLAIAQLFHESGVPRDVFTPIIGSGATGVELLKQRLNGVFFTGSFATGKKIAEQVAGRMMKLQLELGGKDPVYVADDVDVKKCVPSIADGAFYNTGQSCCSVERIYVHKQVCEEFSKHFVDEVRAFRSGDPMSEETYIGPLARKEQLDVLDRQIEDARLKGGTIALGGRRCIGKGYFYEPTVVLNATNEMLLMSEESFGPIIGIQAVSSDKEALKLMNDTEYGLTASVYSHDQGRAQAILSQVNSGSVYWNCCDRVSPRLPWTGRGHSGLGSTLSKIGIHAFLQPKAWHWRVE